MHAISVCQQQTFYYRGSIRNAETIVVACGWFVSSMSTFRLSKTRDAVLERGDGVSLDSVVTTTRLAL